MRGFQVNSRHKTLAGSLVLVLCFQYHAQHVPEMNYTARRLTEVCLLFSDYVRLR